jgi:hypothetical protein
MPTKPSTRREQQQSVKLSVTVKCNLESKYDPAALKQINTAIKRWRKADSKRGIRTVHVAVDDSAEMLRVWRDYFPKAARVRPVSGKVTAPKIKRAIDDLWKRLEPEFLVLFGGCDIVPMFEVWNPAYDPNGDDDEKVPTDNPYASSKRFRPSKRISYLVPDRVIGRIPDMVSDPGATGRNGDPAWFVDYLKTATSWKALDNFYARPLYAICTRECKGAGLDCLNYIERPDSRLFLSPSITDGSSLARKRLSAPVHMIKCHGSQFRPAFYGEKEIHKRTRFLKAIRSATLESRVTSATLVSTMCCYGAQIYSPFDPKAKYRGEWPLASTYLRKGALGFVGSTMKAWVGLFARKWADILAAGYLKNVLAGSSIGRAFLDSKTAFAYSIIEKGKILDLADEKTLIEYVLLGDPSIHPVASGTLPKGLVAVEERRRRRKVRQKLAQGLRLLLPERRPPKPAKPAMAKKVFARAKRDLAKDVRKRLKEFSIQPTVARVAKLDIALGDGTVQPLEEYYWSGQRAQDGYHKQACLVKAQIDRNGTLCRASVMYTS